MTYRRMLYIFAIIKRNHFKMYMFGVVGETHAHDNFEVITYSGILSVLSNKTNLILGFSSPLSKYE